MSSDNNGSFSWNMNKFFPPAPVRTRESLPAAPAGMEWVQNGKTLEWRLIKATNEPVLVTEDRTEIPTPVSPDRNTSENQLLVDDIPVRRGVVDGNEEDWELLSDRASVSSNGVMVKAVCGSVRSIASLENHSGSHTTLSVPFKIQRTASSSTIDSTDGALGPSGKGILGVDYVEHVILPTDTLQGICLTYKIGSTKLRQANHFSGNSLLLAPKKLVIPMSKKALRSGYIRVQDTDAKEYKLHAFLAEFPDLGLTQAKAYLELADWVLKDAIRSAKDDFEWEKDLGDACSMKSGEIRITPKMKHGVAVGFDTTGAGIQRTQKKAVVTRDIPSIATKTVNSSDIVQAAPQHNNFGVELSQVKKKN